MEKAYEEVKGILLAELPDRLAEMATTDIPLPMPQANDILYGPVDVSRHEAKVVFALVPLEMNEDGERDYEDKAEKKLALSILIRGYPSSKMYRMIDRYTHATRLVIRRAGNIDIGKTDYILEAGATVGTMTAAETYLTVRDTEPTYGDPFADEDL